MATPLIPVYCTAFDGEATFRFRTDDSLLALAFNALIPRDDPETAWPLKRAARDLRSMLGPAVDGERIPPVLPYLAEAMNANAVNPFAKKSIAVIGMGDYFASDFVGPDCETLRSLFGRVVDLNAERTEKLTIAKSLDLAATGKFDCVVTGNALNDPRYAAPAETMAAIANIARPGAVILHGTGYSRHHYNLILSDVFHQVCGQELVQAVNPTTAGFDHAPCFDAVLMKQKHDVRLADFYVDWLQNNSFIPKPEP